MIACIATPSFADVKPLPPAPRVQTKFLPLPARKQRSALLAHRGNSYVLSDSIQRRKAPIRPFAAEDKTSFPPSGDAHKLLLYVYDEMR